MENNNVQIDIYVNDPTLYDKAKAKTEYIFKITDNLQFDS